MPKMTFTDEQILKAAAVVIEDDEKQILTEYLKHLLRTLWKEGEEFSGKRPFGNSGWEFDVYKALIKANLITGKLDEDDYVDKVDTEEGDALVLAVIDKFVIV